MAVGWDPDNLLPALGGTAAGLEGETIAAGLVSSVHCLCLQSTVGKYVQ